MTLDRFHSKDVHISEDLDFSSLVSNPALLNGLASAGYHRPSPIQLKTIPLGRLGLDLIAQAKSGTGKTVVFSVIAIESVLSHSAATSTAVSPGDEGESHEAPLQQPKAVIIAPTREIAVQIQDVISSLLSAGLGKSVTCYSMIGGMPIQKDKENLKRCSIVVGTPGRVRSLIETGDLRASQVRLLVLDEADKLMEDVFKEDVYRIAEKLGSTKQVMAFSATYDDDLLSQLDHLVKNPVYVMLSNGTPELEGVLQFYKLATLDEKHKGSSVFLRQMHIMEAKFMELESLLTHVPFYQAIVFLNHRGRAGDLVKFLTRKGWPAMHIASGISQEERLEIMKKARKFELRVLVCSDLIARGIDIDRVNLVVNLDLPKDPETYLHRIGRTGRYGTTGLAVSIVDDAELKTVEILRNDFTITMERLSEEDKVCSELNQRIRNRHHERPLKGSADVDQFKKLEAERKAGEQRPYEDVALIHVNAIDKSTTTPQTHRKTKRMAPESSLDVKRSIEAKSGVKRKRTVAWDRHTLLTPEMTPPVGGYEVEAELASEMDNDEENAGEGYLNLAGETPGDEYDSGTHDEATHFYSQNYAHASFYPHIPAASIAPLTFHPLYSHYHTAYSVYPHGVFAPPGYYPIIAPRTAPFFPPDLPLFPDRSPAFSYFRGQ